MQQVYDIDINEARKGYMPDGGLFSHALYVSQQTELNPRGSSYSAYSPAFIASNEQVREIIEFLQPAGKTALAVAGSGDMPLFLTAYDAVHVDTFDISYNARVIMDIKTYMCQQQMYFCDYASVLRDLWGAYDVLKCKSSNIVCKAVSNDMLKYLDGMRGCKIFARSVINEFRFCPTASEFDALRQKVRERYNFIWSDLFDVCGQITDKSYDIIYLSNVFQYVYNTKDIVNVLSDLRNHLNPNGMMVVDSLLPNLKGTSVQRMKNYHEVGQIISSWAEMIYDKNAMSLFLKMK